MSAICSDFGYKDVESLVEVLSDDGFEQSLPGHVEVGVRQVRFDSGERSLVHVLQGTESVAVLNDEDAFDAVNELMLSGRVDVLPMMSVTFVGTMYDCGALGAAEVELMCDQVVAQVDLLPGMSSDKRTRKMREVEALVARVALDEARKAQASGHG
jgi:hypothetical protein